MPSFAAHAHCPLTGKELDYSSWPRVCHGWQQEGADRGQASEAAARGGTGPRRSRQGAVRGEAVTAPRVCCSYDVGLTLNPQPLTLNPKPLTLSPEP